MPFGYGLWTWFSKNPIAQGVSLVLGGILLWKWNNWVVARQATRRLRDRNALARAEEQARATEHKQTIQQEASNDADEAIAAGRSASTGGLSDAAIARTLGHTRTDGRSGG